MHSLAKTVTAWLKEAKRSDSSVIVVSIPCDPKMSGNIKSGGDREALLDDRCNLHHR